jgi:7-cyano-7-deazaguanine synthase
MKNPDSGAVVLLSGGMDSSVLLHYVVRRLARRPVFALSFHYGQRHARELECAGIQARAAGVEAHRVIDAAFLGDLLNAGSALLTGGAAVPDLATLDPETLRQPPTYVPNRNMILLALAAASAEARGITEVFYGAQAQDEYGYWDCTLEFLERINALLALNRRQPVQIHAPFIDKPKAAILHIGLELEVDFAATWSCYRGQTLACGTCPTCIERLNAFRSLGRTDPLTYTNTAS